MRATFAIVLINACVFMSTCAKPPTLLDLILQGGELRVVTRNSSTTFFYGVDGPRGPEYDLALGFAENLGVKLRMYSAREFPDIFSDIIEWRADIAAAGLTITPARSAKVRFSSPYQEVRQLLVYRLGRPKPKSFADLDGTVVVARGSSFVDTLRAAQPQYPDLRWKERPGADVEELLYMLAQKDIDYTIVDSTEFDISGRYYPELRAAFTVSASDHLAWAMRDGNDSSLYDAIQKYLKTLNDTGKLEQIMARHYNRPKRLDYVGTRSFMRHVDTRLPKYRAWFEQAAAETGLDWQLLAAIGYQESHWDPKAVSPTGVRGIMMLTTATARQLRIEDRTDPQQSILGGARYLLRVRGKIPERIADPDRTWFGLAAYNVGFLHLEDARVLTEMHGKDPDRWTDVREHLPLLAQEKWFKRVKRGYARGWEPVRYVDNVRSYRDILAWALSDRNPAPRDPEPVKTGTESVAVRTGTVR